MSAQFQQPPKRSPFTTFTEGQLKPAPRKKTQEEIDQMRRASIRKANEVYRKTEQIRKAKLEEIRRVNREKESKNELEILA